MQADQAWRRHTYDHPSPWFSNHVRLISPSKISISKRFIARPNFSRLIFTRSDKIFAHSCCEWIVRRCLHACSAPPYINNGIEQKHLHDSCTITKQTITILSLARVFSFRSCQFQRNSTETPHDENPRSLSLHVSSISGNHKGNKQSRQDWILHKLSPEIRKTIFIRLLYAFLQNFPWNNPVYNLYFT